VNRRLIHAVSSCKHALLRAGRPDFEDLFLGEFCPPVVHTFKQGTPPSAFSVSVRRVVGPRAEKEVGRVATAGVIALVADAQGAGLLACS